MGNKEKFRVRDEPIKQSLLSSDEAERKKGLVLVDRIFRKPVASVLISAARENSSPAFDALLNPDSSSLDAVVFREIWHETMASIWENVQKKIFNSNGSLLAYLVTIAKCRTVDRWRKQQRLENGVELELIGVAPNEPASGLKEYIEMFYAELSAADKVILEQGVQFAISNGSLRGIKVPFVKELDRIFREKGWTVKSEAAYVRHYYRLRAELGDFLRRRGYDVKK